MTITIEEFRNKRQELEARLMHLVQAELGKFEAETGVSPSGVSVEMLSIRQLASPDGKWLVGSVSVAAQI